MKSKISKCERILRNQVSLLEKNLDTARNNERLQTLMIRFDYLVLLSSDMYNVMLIDIDTLHYVSSCHKVFTQICFEKWDMYEDDR